jgi:uncharacterized protein
MKAIDMVALALVIIGALNWGLVGLFSLDLVAALFGTSILSAIVYTLVGAAGVFQLFQLKSMQRRWSAVPA